MEKLSKGYSKSLNGSTLFKNRKPASSIPAICLILIVFLALACGRSRIIPTEKISEKLEMQNLVFESDFISK